MKKQHVIGIFSESNTYGGINTFVKDLFLDLRQKEGFDVFLFIPNDDRNKTDTFFDSFKDNRNVVLFKPYGPLLDIFTVRKLILTYHIDLIHTNAYRFNILVKISNLLFRKLPHLVTIHGVYAFSERTLSMRLRYWIDYKSSRLADTIVAVSRKTRDDFCTRARLETKNVHVIYNGVKPLSLETPRMLAQEAVLHIGYLGRLITEKGIQWLCAIISTILKKDKPIIFEIAGSGPESWRIENLAAEFQANVHFHGFTRDIDGFMSKINLLIIPSKTGEGCPLVLLESFSRKIPVIATKDGGMPEMIQDGINGFLVDYLDTATMLDKIQYFCDNPNALDTFGCNGFTAAQESFSIQKMTEEYSQLYLSLIK